MAQSFWRHLHWSCRIQLEVEVHLRCKTCAFQFFAVDRKAVVDNVVELFEVLGRQIIDSNEVSVDESLVDDVVDYVVEPEAKLKSIHSLRKTRNASLGVYQLLQDMKVKQDAHVEKGTRVKVENVGKIVDRWFKGWGWLSNYSFAVNGRIRLLWRLGIHVAFLSESAQCLSCYVDNNGLKFFLSAIYGCNDGMQRRQLWDMLDVIKGLVDFLKIVVDSWSSDASGDPMRRLFVKLKRLKPVLKQFNRERFGELPFKFVAARKEMEAAQLDILSGSSYGSIEKVHELKVKLFDLKAAERSFYKHKARVKNMRQSIQSLVSTDGTKFETQAQISNEIVSFFFELLGSKDLGVNVNVTYVQLLQELLLSSLCEDEANHLVREFSDEEIRSAIFEQRNDKPHGPDGYSACFFKTAWYISKLLVGFNATTIVLVPKVLSPNQVKDFHPISCCSVVYKCITKILVNMISPTLPNLITLNLIGKGIVAAQPLSNRVVRFLLSSGRSFRDFCSLIYSGGLSRDLDVNSVEIKDSSASCHQEIKLSFAGRFEVIRSPIFSLCSFWCRQLIIPKGVLNRINQLCMCRAVCRSDASASGARVGWDKVCTLRSEWVLGLCDLTTWSNACIVILEVVLLCNISPVARSWEQELQWVVQGLKGKSLLVVILRLTWNAFIYFVWKERNVKVFCNVASHILDIVLRIRDIVQAQLGGRVISRTGSINSMLCQRWGISVR
ncbi:hypothetical protein GQ457_18G025600 [Hibiscus cannabinus]